MIEKKRAAIAGLEASLALQLDKIRNQANKGCSLE
jgi:hypothetical protein